MIINTHSNFKFLTSLHGVPQVMQDTISPLLKSFDLDSLLRHTYQNRFPKLPIHILQFEAEITRCLNITF